ncbi:MAG: hypothetical protein NTV99_08265 [Deltaproteobacteria bacterium]|nr:hypothetical protein [Deltaproteobacteria bacterium]
MTVRDVLNKKKRYIAILLYFSFAIFLLGFLFSVIFPAFAVIGFWGFGIFFVTLGYAYFGIRCPVCRGIWGILAMRSGTPFSISRKLKFCPYCGVDLDSQDERMLLNRTG